MGGPALSFSFVAVVTYQTQIRDRQRLPLQPLEGGRVVIGCCANRAAFSDPEPVSTLTWSLGGQVGVGTGEG